MSKIVILSGSVRRGGNTDILVSSFAEGAEKNGDEVDIISVADYKVNPCIGCNVCFKREGNACFQKDDMEKIYDALKTADVLVVASPVYFYGLSAQLKAVIDRFHNPIRNGFTFRKTALLLVGADTIPELFDAIKTQYRLTVNYFKLQDAGMVCVGGAEEKGAIKNNAEALKAAYELGLSI